MVDAMDAFRVSPIHSAQSKRGSHDKALGQLAISSAVVSNSRRMSWPSCFFHGVFRKLRYDNLTAAVKKIFQGYRREETARFIAFRSHWRFQSEFCTPAEAHEKGGVEGEAGYFRRNHWVPVPEASDLTDLNRQLLAACHRDEGRRISGRNQSIGAALLVEREHLLSLAMEGMDLAWTSFPVVNSLGCVKVLTNCYSAPLQAG